MKIFETIYWLISVIFPFECMKLTFMQQAMLGLLLIAPAAAIMGIQVVNFRMAFFADAIGHSAFTGVALGLIFAINPYISMSIFALLMGLSIMKVQRKSNLSIDTVIGVFFSGVIAFGLAMVSREKNAARNVQRFLYGDILTITENEILAIFILSIIILLFQIFAYNRLFYIGINQTLAQTHRVKTSLYQYLFAILLSLVVIFSVWMVGVLLVTALLIVPAAAARNLARSASATFWWAIFISISSSVIGLLISAQEWANTAVGATVVLVAFSFFLISLFFAKPQK